METIKRTLEIPFSEENCKIFSASVKNILEQHKKDDEVDQFIAEHSIAGGGLYYDYHIVEDTLIDILTCFLPKYESSDEDIWRNDAVNWFVCEEITAMVTPEDANSVKPKTENGNCYNCSVEVDGETVYYNIETPEQLYYFEWGKYDKLQPVL